jgi:hypothetical protein
MNTVLKLLFVCVVFYVAMLWWQNSTDEKVAELKKMASDIHHECNISIECPFPPTGWTPQSEEVAVKGPFHYWRYL